jgi:putative ABC transport system substrate-binding protein
MRRRDFMTLAGGMAVWPLAARAQQPANMPVVGILWHGENEREEAYWFGLQRKSFADLGYIPGKNIIFEDRYADESAERHADNAAELVRMKVNVIIANNFIATLAAKKATTTIPIVFIGPDPVRSGLVTNLPHPGGNITGFSYMYTEMDAKRLQLFKMAIPSLARVGLLLNPDFKVNAAVDTQEYEAAAPTQGVTLEIFEARDEGEVKSVFSKIAQSQLDGLIIGQVPRFEIWRTEIARMALDAKIPLIANSGYWADDGALFSYSCSLPPLYREWARYTLRILAGEKPGDLPVQQATTFELAFNMRTAHALGLSIPDKFLVLADRVIE